MGDEALLKDVKSMLRAVLQSKKEGVLAARLTSEYRGMTGDPLPYKKLGFPTLESFLTSIPDVIHGRTNRDGELCYFPKADESTAHIQRMVAAQRSSRKGKPGKSKFRRPAPHRTPARYVHKRLTPRSYAPTASPARPRVGLINPPMPNQGMKVVVNQRQPATPTRNVIFGSSYAVPPRFQKAYNVTVSGEISPPLKPSVERAASPIDATDGGVYKSRLHNYTAQEGLPPPKYDTQPAGNMGFVSSVTVGKKVVGSISIFKVKKHAEFAAAKNACEQLGVQENGKGRKRRKSNASQQDLLKLQEDVQNLTFTITNEDAVKSRVKEILSGRQNGLWNTRLPVEYKEKFKEEAPPNLLVIIENWPDVVKVDSVTGTDRKILYPVQDSLPKPMPTTAKSLPKPSTSSPAGSTSSLSSAGSRRSSQGSTAISLVVLPSSLPAVGSRVNVEVCQVNTIQDFYVVTTEGPLTNLMEKIQKIYTKNAGPQMALSRSEFVIGTYCVAKYFEDQQWYRVKIVGMKQDRNFEYHVDLFNIDYGSTDTVKGKELQKLLPELADVPAQAIHCGIHGLEAIKEDECNDYFQDQVSRAELRIIVMEHRDDTCLVVIDERDADENSQSLNAAMLNRGLARKTGEYIAIEPDQLEVPDEGYINVYVSYVNSTTDMVIRMVGDEHSDKLEELEFQIGRTVANSPPPDVVERGTVYAAVVEETWFRVRAKEIDGDVVLCEFVDHGDSEKINRCDLRTLAMIHNQLPYQKIKCSLLGLDTLEENEKVTDQLFKLALGKTMVAEIVERSGLKLVVQLFDTSGEDDVNICETLVNMVSDEELRPRLPEVDAFAEGYISYIDSEGHVYFQMQGPGLTRLDELMEDIAAHYSKKTGADEFVSKPTVDKLVCAKYPEDDYWYRALITDVQESRKVEVHFVDYGNSAVLPCSSLREMTKANTHLKTLPFQAIECKLHDLPPEGGTWEPEALLRIAELAPPDALLTLKLHGHDGGLPVVELFVETEDDQGENICYSINQFMLLKERESFFELVTNGSEVLVNEGNEDVNEINNAPNEDVDDVVENNNNLENNNNMDYKTQDRGDGLLDDLKRHLCKLTLEECAKLPMPPKIELPEQMEYFDVHVPWVLDPYNFVVTPYQDTDKVKDMMKDMYQLYQDKLTNASVSSVQEGDLLAGFYEEMWYRVVIKALVKDTNQVTVQFIDFGDFSILPISNLRPLPAQFRVLPFQAMKAKLVGVQPNKKDHGEWSNAAIERFTALAREQNLVALVFKVDPEPLKLHVKLVDTSTNEDVMINEILIKEGLAEETDTNEYS